MEFVARDPRSFSLKRAAGDDPLCGSLPLQHQLPLLPDHALRGAGKLGEQPGQRDFEPHRAVVNLDRAGGALAERTGAEAELVARPALLLERDQRGELGLGAAEARLDAGERLVLAELVRNDDDQRLGHYEKSPGAGRQMVMLWGDVE